MLLANCKYVSKNFKLQHDLLSFLLPQLSYYGASGMNVGQGELTKTTETSHDFVYDYKCVKLADLTPIHKT